MVVPSEVGRVGCCSLEVWITVSDGYEESRFPGMVVAWVGHRKRSAASSAVKATARR